MSISYKTPNYFLEFHCLGGDCEDTCCQDWEIKLDKHHYDLLQQKMTADPDEKSCFETYIRINERPVMGDYDYAHILMREDGKCPMLGQDGLCNIHRKYGEEPLGNVCAFFPRVISRCGNDMEMTGALSCPEVARLCLLHEEPVRMSRFNVSTLPRSRNYPILRELPMVEGDHYAAHFKQIRTTLMAIVNKDSYPLDSRLFALATFANRISTFYHKDCQPVNELVLEEAITDATDDAVMTNLNEYLLQYTSSDPVCLIVIHSILQLKLQQFPDENLSKLIAEVMARYQQQHDNGEAMTMEVLQTMVTENTQRIHALFGNRLEQYFSRYLINCLMREWFYTMPDTFTYVQMMIIRLAMLRFLVYSHPQMLALLQRCETELRPGEALPTEVREELDKLIVAVVYNFARAIDQNLPFLQVVYNAVSEQQMMNFDYSLAFIRY